MNPLDRDDAVVLGFYLAGDVSDKCPFARWYLTRFQRASEGAGESAAGRGDEVVERCRSLGLCAGSNAVVLTDTRVDAEHHWFGLRRDLRSTQRTADPLDPNLGGVHGLGHQPAC